MANIFKTAEQAGKFTTLLWAIQEANLADILNSPGPYTVFAPTDEAFAKLPEGTIESLAQDIPKLKRVVSYHVTFGDVRAEDLMEIAEAETVEGSVVAIDSSDGLKVNDAQVIESDVMADNGVIHVIDTVLIPGLLAAES